MRTEERTGWLPLTALLLVGLSCDGGADSVCMEACDRIGECSEISGTVMGCTFTEQECSGFNGCASECVVAAPCAELLMKPDAEGYGDTGYAQCLSTCWEGAGG